MLEKSDLDLILAGPKVDNLVIEIDGALFQSVLQRK